MPIQGSFYTSQELQQLLGVTRQAVANIAARAGWRQLIDNVAIYCAEEVEPYLFGRNIDPATLTVWDYEYPDGATQIERDDAFAEDYEAMINSPE